MRRARLKQNAFEFKPFSVKQKKVLTWWCKDSPVKDKDGIVADGAIRSGKTLCMSLSFVLWAMSTFNQQNLGMAGKTIGSFRRNVLFWLKLMLKSRRYHVVDHRTDNMLEVSKNGVINYFYIFGGKDERSQDLIQGITLAGMFFDEVALMPESFVNQATGRCSVDGSKYWFNCNPDNPRHWFKLNWIDKAKEKNLVYLHFTMDDNLSLSPKIKQRYRSMYVGVFFKRFIEGIWCVADGLVYSMFDEDKHVIHGECPYSPMHHVSIDYGTVNPFSAGMWGFDGKRAIRERELYYNGREKGVRLDDETYYQKLKELIGDTPIEYIIIDPSAASFIEVIKKHGEYMVKGAKNDVLDGIRVTTTFLNTGRLFVHESCTNTIEEFGLYSWDEESGDDKVIKENDHAMDDTRYYCNTFMRKWLRWEC
ncbi:MAG TPA: PBSX family phage terminase large subunit [Lachnospiraceae bacterium]|nr:PBSX family phage terminase large subunit [Lachnospiraceae bacterium]